MSGVRFKWGKSITFFISGIYFPAGMCYNIRNMESDKGREASMCGFVGFTGTLENRADIIKHMADRIIHRGPDMEGYHVGEDGVTGLPPSLHHRSLRRCTADV